MQDSTCCHTRYGDLTPPTTRGLLFVVIRSLSPVGVCSPDGKPMSDEICRLVSDNPFHRMMRRTGKLYSLTLTSVSLGIISSVLVSLWNFNTSEFHLWLDLIPNGFGIASIITTTLIVSIRTSRWFLLESIFLIQITGHDRERGQGGYCRRHGHHISFPDDWSSTRGQLERGASPGHPHETASEADHRTRSFRGLIHFLSSFSPVHLTLEPSTADHRTDSP